MKKSDIILIGIVLVIVVVAIFASKGTSALEDIDFPLELEGEKGLNQITYSEYKKMVDNDKACIVIIERSECS